MNIEIIQAICSCIKYGIIAISVAYTLIMIVKHSLSLDHEEKRYALELKILEERKALINASKDSSEISNLKTEHEHAIEILKLQHQLELEKAKHSSSQP